MRKILTGLFAIVLFSTIGKAQPYSLATNNLNGSPFTCADLDDLGTYKRLRVQATQSSAAATWELPQNCSFPGNVWRPYTSSEATAIPFNVVIPPTPGTYGALWNSNNGGATGKLSPVTNGNYYTFNVENITCNAGICNSPHIGVLETTYFPVSFPTVTQSPLADVVGANVPVTITVTSSAPPIENVFLRYTINEYVNTTIVPVVFSGTTGTAVIPGFPLGTTVKYYIYSSNKSQSLIESEVVEYGEIAHDMSTLDWNVNTGSNYPYTVIDIAPITIQYLKGVKQSGFNELSWKLECSNVDAVNMSLERSNDGRNYSTIQNINTDPVRCNEVFRYKDNGFKNGLNYYRLNIHNLDGRSNYSNVVALLNAGAGFEIVNLSSDNAALSFQLTASKTMKADMKLIDMSGRTLKNLQSGLMSGVNSFNWDINNLPSGVYCLAVRSEDGILKTARFIRK